MSDLNVVWFWGRDVALELTTNTTTTTLTTKAQRRLGKDASSLRLSSLNQTLK